MADEADENRKEPLPVDPEKLLAELEIRQQSLRAAARGTQARYRNLLVALILLAVSVMAALWFLMTMLGQMPRPAHPPKKAAEVDGNSRLPSRGQLPKMSAFRWTLSQKRLPAF